MALEPCFVWKMPGNGRTRGGDQGGVTYITIM